LDPRSLKRMLVAFAIVGLVGILFLVIAPLFSAVLLVVAEVIFVLLYLRVSGKARTRS
jgi:hypothetical protein